MTARICLAASLASSRVVEGVEASVGASEGVSSGVAANGFHMNGMGSKARDKHEFEFERQSGCCQWKMTMDITQSPDHRQLSASADVPPYAGNLS